LILFPIEDLVNDERFSFEKVLKMKKQMCEIYGGIHLLRLIGKELLSDSSKLTSSLFQQFSVIKREIKSNTVVCATRGRLTRKSRILRQRHFKVFCFFIHLKQNNILYFMLLTQGTWTCNVTVCSAKAITIWLHQTTFDNLFDHCQAPRQLVS